MSPSSRMARVVLVTGCSQGGIGAELCKQLHKLGCKVFPTARSLHKMKQLQDLGMEAKELDVNDPKSVTQVLQEVLTSAGKLDIVINNAGVGLTGPWLDATEQEVRDVMETNFFAVARMCQEAGKIMVKQRSGLIVNIGSVASWTHAPFVGPYCCSKTAVESMSTSLRLELKPFGVHVMYVAPGLIRSNLSSNAPPPPISGAQSEGWVEQASSIYEDIPRELRYYEGNTNSSKATPTDVFAAKCVAQILKSKPPSAFRYGSQSTAVAIFFSWPLRWLGHYITYNVVGLAKLAKALKKT